MYRVFALPLALLAAAPAFAQDAAPAADPNRDFVILGAGAAILPDYEGSDESRWAPIPAAAGRIGGFNFQYIGNRASVDLVRDTSGPGWDFQAGPLVAVNLDRTSTKSIEDARVKALGKLDTTIEAGGFIGIGRVGVITSDYDRLSLSLSYRRGLGGAHEAGVLTPSVTYMTPLSRKALVGIYGSAEHVDDGYNDAYFSISPVQALASGLPAYTARGGWKSYTLGAGGAVSLSGDLTHGLQLVGGATYRRLRGDAARSPITRIAGSPNQWMGMLGLAYSF